GRRQPARRMLDRVGKNWRRLAEARLALRQRSAEVDRKVARVPKDLKDHPGLIYERVRWRRRKKINDSARDLLLETGMLGSGALKNTYLEKVWTERTIQTRKALAAGEISNAYRLANNHGLTRGAKFAEAEWLAGWIALRYLEDYEPAYRHFTKLYDAVKYPISISRAAYWAARSATARGDNNLAVRWYAEAARYPTTFYGQLAAQRLAVPAKLVLPDQPTFSTAEKKAFDSLEIVQVVRMLKELEDDRRLNLFILRLYRLDETAPRTALVADLARSLDRPDLAVMVTKRAAQKGMIFASHGYPVINLLEVKGKKKGKANGGPETALVLALSRQESAFNPKVVSHAGAHGLMQLMPATARATARMIRVSYSKKRLSEPDYNTTLGRAHLRSLLDDFEGSYILSLAAYNAGKHRVKKWLKEYGDPRLPEADPIDWVENIPFQETRNYVQRVLENVQIYRQRLAGHDVLLRLEEDLARGTRTDGGYVKPLQRPIAGRLAVTANADPE
ncbi:MAG: lytic transglycosylase domain-containing protein, partial [Rhodospirillales bacterium]|nr:lytic transglycosylase domain-containing protein [Rhodospirillales bacterium]